jgi:hypothetical protein
MSGEALCNRHSRHVEIFRGGVERHDVAPSTNA